MRQAADLVCLGFEETEMSRVFEVDGSPPLIQFGLEPVQIEQTRAPVEGDALENDLGSQIGGHFREFVRAQVFRKQDRGPAGDAAGHS